MIDKRIKTVSSLRVTLIELKREEDRRLDELKALDLYQEYDAYKQDRLAVSKEVKSAEDGLRQALVDHQLIDGDSRHPAVKSVTRKTAYEYDAGDALEYALDNELAKLLTVDTRKFELYLAFLAEAGEPLPDFVEVSVAVSVALVSDLSEVAE